MATKNGSNSSNHKTWWTILAITIFILAIVFIFKLHNRTYAPSPKVPMIKPNTQVTKNQAITSSGNSFCTPRDLQGTISLSPGAGNIYGTFTLTNISSHQCKVSGGEFIEVRYNPSITNISVIHVGQTQAMPFILAPNQSIYSQVHYPNGPQCSSAAKPVSVSFTYAIDAQKELTFKDANGKAEQQVQACKSPNDMTQIQIWNMATQPITPQ